MLYRVIDKATGLFIRDDFAFDEATEIGLDVEPGAKGYHKRMWDFANECWYEGATPEEIEAIIAQQAQPTEPTLEERVTQNEADIDAVIDVVAQIEGVSL